MVARLARLRLGLFVSTLRGPYARVLLSLLSVVTCIGFGIASAYAPIIIAQSGTISLLDADILFVNGLVLLSFGWAFLMPDRVLGPRHFGQYPARPTVIALALMLTTIITRAGLVAVAWAITMFVTRGDVFPNVLSTVGLLVLLVILWAVAINLASQVATLFVTTKFARGLQRMLGLLALIAFVPVGLYFSLTMTPRESRQALSDVIEMAAWSPMGALVTEMHRESPTTSALPATLGLTWVLVIMAVSLMLVWLATKRLVTTVERPTPGTMMRSSTGWFDVLPLNPTMAITARSLTYWVNDPRYWVSIVAIPIIPIIVLAVMLVAGLNTATLIVILLPLMFILIGWMIHNDVASDSTAFWIHVASGIQGWQDRLGRLMPVYLIGIPLLFISSSIAVMVLSDWRVFPSMFGLGLVALSASAAVSSVVSVVGPYPTTRPHESPFVQPLWYRSGAGVSQTISMLASVGLTLPAFMIVQRYIQHPELSEQFALLGFGLAYAVILGVIGVGVGGLIFNHRSSNLLTFVQQFD